MPNFTRCRNIKGCPIILIWEIIAISIVVKFEEINLKSRKGRKKFKI